MSDIAGPIHVGLFYFFMFQILINLKTNFDIEACGQLTVTNCMIKTSCASLKICNESAKDFKQITFSNWIIYESTTAISISSEEGEIVKDVLICNIVADNIVPLILTRPTHISLLKSKKGNDGAIRNITISNFIYKTQGRILLTAPEGLFLENIQLRNIKIQYPWIEDPFFISDSARSAQYPPQNKIARKQRAAIIAENVNNLHIKHSSIEWPAKAVPSEWQLATRIENGSKPVTFKPDYKKNKETDLACFWGKGLTGGYIWLPGSTHSSDKGNSVVLQNCKDFTIS